VIVGLIVLVVILKKRKATPVAEEEITKPVEEVDKKTKEVQTSTESTGESGTTAETE
jgi:hypothetical protein